MVFRRHGPALLLLIGFLIEEDQQHAQRIEPPTGREAIAMMQGKDIVPSQFMGANIFDGDTLMHKR